MSSRKKYSLRAPNLRAPTHGFKQHGAVLPPLNLQLYALQPEQRHLFVQAAGITGQVAAGADDPVAGNDDGDRIVPHGAAYRPGRHLAGSSWGDSLFSTGSSFGSDLFSTSRTFTAALWGRFSCRC